MQIRFRRCCKIIFLHDELIASASLHLDLDWIQNVTVRRAVDLRLAAHQHETWLGLAAFLDDCDSTEIRSLITEAVTQERAIPNPEQQLPDVILKLRNQCLDRQIAALTVKLSQPEAGQIEDMLREQNKLRDLKRAPLSTLTKN